MSFEVETENLRDQAKIWQDAGTHVDTARSNIADCIGKGDDFGFMAGSCGVSGHYDEWTSDMDNALTDASYSFGYLDAALTSTANGYDTSDATSATSMAELDKRLNQGSYHHD